jgi:solute carrier family 25 carnitine/acylcarnitine transporter 20/29
MPNDFMFGLIGGIVGTLVSHPPDTIKTRLQTGISKNFKNALLMGNLYRGLSAPLLGIGFEKLIVFGFYGECKKLGFSDGISGLIGGFASTLVVVPVDRIKILMQNKETITKNIFTFRSLYKGFGITLFRETPGFGIYFTTYNKLTNNFNKEKNLLKSFLFGSISGFTSWIFIYPSDLIKTKYQAIKNNSDTKVINVIKEIYKNYGYRGFYNGFKYAIMRAIPLHGGVFLGYEFSKQFYKNNF